MKNKIRNNYISAIIFLILFVLFTILVKTVDVKPVGPQESLIGFSAVNIAVFNFFGQNSICYNITELIGYVALLTALFFGIYVFMQLCRRKSLIKVDFDIIFIAVLYVVTALAYIFFEIMIVNYRPVLVGGLLEASYPSSHTMLVVTILGSASMLVDRRVKNAHIKRGLKVIFSILIIATVIGRVASGFHWVTDVIGAVLLSAFLLMIYYSAVKHIEYAKSKEEIKK